MIEQMSEGRSRGERHRRSFETSSATWADESRVLRSIRHGFSARRRADLFSPHANLFSITHTSPRALERETTPTP